MKTAAKRKPTARALAKQIPGVKVASDLRYQRPKHAVTCKCGVCTITRASRAASRNPGMADLDFDDIVNGG